MNTQPNDLEAVEYEPKSRFIIQTMEAEDIDLASEMRKQSWIDTYVNSKEGITKEWIEDLFKSKLDPATHDARTERFEAAKQKGTLNAWVAKDVNGAIIGSTTPFLEASGRQRVGSIYVDKKWHGSGVGSQLMRRVVDWFDSKKPIYLEVVSYNERAKAFYRKWGFEEIEGSEAFYDDKLPEITMVRLPQSQQVERENNG